jgi:hypothetical protein
MNQQIRTLRYKIKGECWLGDITQADRDALLDFSRELQLRQSEYSDHRHAKLLSHCRTMARDAGPITEALEDESAAKRIVNWIHSTYDSEETDRDFRVALRRFGAILANSGGYVPEDVDVSDRGIPRTIDWISATTSSTYDPAPDPGQMLKWDEDVKPMLEAASNERDAAAIALQFDAGLRGGEFVDLTVGSISDHRHGLQVTVQGKQGQRSVTLIPSVPYIKRWLAAHPAGDDPDAPLWTKVNSPEEVSRSYKNRIFKKAADKAGVSKPVTPTNFRKSSASWAASRGMNQAHIEDRYGWVRGSTVASRYVAIFEKDSDLEYAKLHGLDVEEDEPEDRSPLECPNCGQDTPRDKDLCVWCGQALEPQTAQVVNEIEGHLLDSIRNAEDTEEVEAGVSVLEKFRESPEQRSELIEELSDALEG